MDVRRVEVGARGVRCLLGPAGWRRRRGWGGMPGGGCPGFRPEPGWGPGPGSTAQGCNRGPGGGPGSSDPTPGTWTGQSATEDTPDGSDSSTALEGASAGPRRDSLLHGNCSQTVLHQHRPDGSDYAKSMC